MRQDVNLYTEAFRPSREWLTLNTAARLGIAALLVIIVASGWAQYRVAQLQQEQAELERDLSRIQEAIERLDEQLAQQQRDPRLEEQVERLEERVADRKRLVERADSVARASSEGFTPYLSGLAKQSREELWLTRIQVNLIHDRLRLEGRTTQGQQVPDYLQQLRDEPVFEGRRFAQFEISRDEQAPYLAFDVASRRDNGEENE